MRSYLAQFLEEFAYEPRDAQFLLAAYDALCADARIAEKWQALLDAYAADPLCDYALLREGAREVGRQIRTHPYTMELLLHLCMTKTLKERYLARGLSLQIFRDTVLDLRYKLEECKAVFGICGSFVAPWFAGFFKLTRFALGRLQFELVDCPWAYTHDGRTVRKGDPVINIHIPRTGTPMDEKSVEASLAQAAAFFKNQISGDTAFVCHSWLLYPAHEQMLDEKTNVRKFMARFDILEYADHDDTHPDLWRLMDRKYTGDPDDLPYDSSLRRAYVDRLKSGGKTGWGHGIFFYK